MMHALEAGAEDFNAEEDSFEIVTSPESFSEVRQKLEETRNTHGFGRSNNGTAELYRSYRP